MPAEPAAALSSHHLCTNAQPCQHGSGYKQHRRQPAGSGSCSTHCMQSSVTLRGAHSVLPFAACPAGTASRWSLFNISVALSDTHVGKAMNPETDCLHYCSPGLPEVRDMCSWTLACATTCQPAHFSNVARATRPTISTAEQMAKGVCALLQGLSGGCPSPEAHCACPTSFTCCAQLWVYNLFNAFRSGQTGIRPLSDSKAQQESGRARFSCVKSYAATFRT